MSDFERIRSLLRAVRRRTLLEAALRVAGFTAAAILTALSVLALCAARVGPASFWPGVTSALLIFLTGAGAAALWLFGVRRHRSERALARLVGRRHPALASDLLSAVELGGGAVAPASAGSSRPMLDAFLGAVAARAAKVTPNEVVTLKRARRAGAAALAALLLLLSGVAFAPGTFQRGLGLLVRRPTLFEGAAVSHEPLLGDVRLTYEYPPYTGLPNRVIDGSTGDVVAVKGTKVRLETQLLRRARKALLLLGDSGEGGTLPVTLTKNRLSATLKLEASGSYRVWLSPYLGRPVREARAHRILVEADQAPRVEIQGPADRLELKTPRPIEVGYQAADDFGLGKIDLVYRVEDGPEQRIPLVDAEGNRTARGRTVFEPDTTRLGPGGLVSYRVEARDRDAVSGAKAGSSRTLYIVIQNPREDLDAQLEREKEILERLVESLADRLELGDSPLPAAAPLPDAIAHLAARLRANESEEAQLTALGRVIDDERREGGGNKALVAALSQIADRLVKVLREEDALLAPLRARADVGTLSAGAFGKLNAHAGRHVATLEEAVLKLDDLIGRQRLDDLAGLARELTDAYKRMQDLLTRYQSTKDEALRRQLERELRDLKLRIEELARKIGEVKARNEVATEWQNMPDMQKALDRANDVGELLKKGDPQSLAQAMAELGKDLSALQKQLESNADEFDGARFPQENRALSELLKKIGDLEGDERTLAGDGQSLSGEMDQELQRRLQGQLDQALAEARQQLGELRKQLGTPAPRELGEDPTDQLRRAQESAKQLERLLEGRELGEAKKEAQRAAESLRDVRRALAQRAAQKRPVSAAHKPFSQAMNEAGGLAERLAEKLEKLVPRGEELLAPGQQERARGLAQRQGTLGQRAEELAGEAQQKAGKVRGLDKATEELRSIGEQMGQSSAEFAEGSMKEGSGKARDAADRLAQLREQLQNEQRGGRRQQRDPVRIPGADESQAPREWRQELMEAMRERAPERYKDEVRKYYEELVK